MKKSQKKKCRLSLKVSLHTREIQINLSCTFSPIGRRSINLTLNFLVRLQRNSSLHNLLKEIQNGSTPWSDVGINRTAMQMALITKSYFAEFMLKTYPTKRNHISTKFMLHYFQKDNLCPVRDCLSKLVRPRSRLLWRLRK